MRLTFAFTCFLGALVLFSTPSQAQATKITNGQIISKQPNDCDAMCHLQGKVNQITSQLETLSKTNAKLQADLAADEKQLLINSFKIVGLEANYNQNKAMVDSTFTHLSANLNCKIYHVGYNVLNHNHKFAEGTIGTKVINGVASPDYHGADHTDIANKSTILYFGNELDCPQ